MKRLIFIAVTITLLHGCMIPYVVISSSIDYKKYSDAGFFITESNSVNFEYDPISSVYSFANSGYIKGNSKSPINKNDDLYGNYEDRSDLDKSERKSRKEVRNKFISASPEDALHGLYVRAVESGADGIINLKIQPVLSGFKYMSKPIYNYTATGMAIKRK